MFSLSLRVDFQDIPTLECYCLRLIRKMHLPNRGSQNLFCGCIEIQTLLRIMIEAERIVSLHKVQAVLPVQHRETERTLN